MERAREGAGGEGGGGGGVGEGGGAEEEAIAGSGERCGGCLKREKNCGLIQNGREAFEVRKGVVDGEFVVVTTDRLLALELLDDCANVTSVVDSTGEVFVPSMKATSISHEMTKLLMACATSWAFGSPIFCVLWGAKIWCQGGKLIDVAWLQAVPSHFAEQAVATGEQVVMQLPPLHTALHALAVLTLQLEDDDRVVESVAGVVV